MTSLRRKDEILALGYFFCAGYNQWGELGLGDNNDRGDDPNEMGDNLDFVDLGDDVSVKSIALGDWHT